MNAFQNLINTIAPLITGNFRELIAELENNSHIKLFQSDKENALITVETVSEDEVSDDRYQYLNPFFNPKNVLGKLFSDEDFPINGEYSVEQLIKLNEQHNFEFVYKVDFFANGDIIFESELIELTPETDLSRGYFYWAFTKDVFNGAQLKANDYVDSHLDTLRNFMLGYVNTVKFYDLSTFEYNSHLDTEFVDKQYIDNSGFYKYDKLRSLQELLDSSDIVEISESDIGNLLNAITRFNTILNKRVRV